MGKCANELSDLSCDGDVEIANIYGALTNELANVACNIVIASANATNNPAQLQAAGAGKSTVASSNMYCLFSF